MSNEEQSQFSDVVAADNNNNIRPVASYPRRVAKPVFQWHPHGSTPYSVVLDKRSWFRRTTITVCTGTKIELVAGDRDLALDGTPPEGKRQLSDASLKRKYG